MSIKKLKNNLLQMECQKIISNTINNNFNMNDEEIDEQPKVVYNVETNKTRKTKTTKVVTKTRTTKKTIIEETIVPQNNVNSVEPIDLECSLKYQLDQIKLTKSLKMTDEYFLIFDYYAKIYGHDMTVVFLQNGTFYELYGIDNEKEKCFAQIKTICNILDVVLSRKDKKILHNDRDNVLMAGVPVHSTKKHIQKLLDNGYTIILYNQVERPDGSYERKLEEIISPSIQLDYETSNKDNNYCVSVYLYCGNHFVNKKEIWSASICCMDVSTGKMNLYELMSSNSQSKTLEDRKENLFMDIKRILNVCPCYEILLTIEFEKDILNNLTENHDYFDFEYWKSELNIENKKCYIYFNTLIDNKDFEIIQDNHINKIFNQNANHWHKQSFQENYLNRIFTKRKSKMLQLLEEFNLENEFTRKSLMILCQFIHNHNSILLKDLDNPKWYDTECMNEYKFDYLKFENNTLDQLNVFSNQINQRTLKNQYTNITSLFDVINHTCSVLGYRYLKECLYKPYSKKNKDTILKVNKHIDISIKNELDNKLRNKFTNLFDIERYYRKIQLQNIQIYELYNFYDTITKCIEIGNIWNIYFQNEYRIDVITMKQFTEWFETIYEVENLQFLTNFKSNSIKSNQNFIIFREGICKEIDKITEQMNDYKDKLEEEKNIFEKKYNCDCKLDNSDKDGYYLTITTAKYNKTFTGNKNQNYKFKVQSSIVKVTNNILDEISRKLDECQMKLIEMNKKKWNEYLYVCIDKINEEWNIQIAYMDFILNGAYIATRNNYICPIIEEKEYSYVDIKSLRHPLIEKILPNHQKYIANDISIGEDNETGYVIFGTNSCGKSVLMKSVGIAIILAQIGYYVPCNSMKYSPFNNILTRITGKDDCIKGHSSFTIEMLELNLILQKSNRNSLVIGDEICHGTENTSGIAIMSSTLIHLSKNKIPFILTSHLHHLSKVEEVICNENIKFKHLTVKRDIVNNRLIYERKLCDGSGLANYGIEVAKFIIYNQDFIDMSEKIRYKLLNDNCQGELLPIKKSKYNSSKLLGMCEVCEIFPANQTHHINEQHKANKNKYVYSVNDNREIHLHNKSNLVGLCENCHLAVHGKNKLEPNKKLIIYGYELTTDGEILKYEYI